MDIQRRVFSNLSRFRDHIGDFPPQASLEREYRILLDVNTGEMQFSGKVNTLEFRKRRSSFDELKQVCLCVINQNDGRFRFELKGIEKQEIVGATKETLDVLNEMVEKNHGTALNRFPEKMILENLSSVYTQINRRRIEKHVSFRGNITAEEAEKYLRESSPGSYLIREEKEVSSMVEQMKRHYGFDVSAYCLVYVGENRQIQERLILGLPQGWILYGDDPDLRKYEAFEDPNNLLKQMGLDGK